MTQETTPPFVLSETKGKVVLLTLNHAKKSNSLHPELVQALNRHLQEIESNPEINVVVLTGAGRNFCAGLDLSLLLTWTAEEKLQYLETVSSLFQRIWMLPQPVIAAVRGAALAGGFDLSAFCDIRLAAENSIFGQAEINIGLTQIIHPLYKSIGLARAKELALTGAPIPAAEAWRIGLVNHVFPEDQVLAKAMAMAEGMAAKSRFALFETKRLTRELIDLDTKQALAEINRTFLTCLDSEEHRIHLERVYRQISSKG
ncbi:MAG: enoyl-CoA hydratase/isomerase family protein [Blastocatellia bacterium]|nr:enoyl-CoA hydratase/isomerase family protein [Blastocatellia bacterium]